MNRAVGSVVGRKPCGRVVNLYVYAIITAANEAPDQVLTSP